MYSACGGCGAEKKATTSRLCSRCAKNRDDRLRPGGYSKCNNCGIAKNLSKAAKCRDCTRDYVQNRWKTTPRKIYLLCTKCRLPKNATTQNWCSMCDRENRAKRKLEGRLKAYASCLKCNAEKPSNTSPHCNSCIGKWRRIAYEKDSTKFLERVARRNAKKRSSGGSYSASEWLAVCVKQRHRCALCGKKPVKLTVDHIVPVVRGGTSWISNIQALCHSCNARKNDSYLGVFWESLFARGG